MKTYFIRILILITLILFLQTNIDFLAQPEIKIPNDQMKYYLIFFKIYPEAFHYNYPDLLQKVLSLEQCKLNSNPEVIKHCLYNINKLYAYKQIKQCLICLSTMLYIIVIYNITRLEILNYQFYNND